jgi:uncharacterized damage-inducible protein DinB
LPTNTNPSLETVEPLPGYEPTIGRLLWSLEDTRRETKAAIANLTPSALDWAPASGDNTIGTLLYHIALIELDWLCVEVLENETYPEELQASFAIDHRDEQGHLSLVRDATIEEHIQRLDLVREHLLNSFREMPMEEFRRLRRFPDYQVTPEWVLHHLIQHEAEHRGHIQMLRSLAERNLEA